MEEIKRTLRGLAGSKKFVVFLVTVVLATAGRLGLDLDPDLVEKIVVLAVAYLVGQGIADLGRGRVDPVVLVDEDQQGPTGPSK